jgi:hypothetical protein
VKCYLVKKRKENIDNGMDNFLFEYYNKKIENFIFFIYIIKQNALVADYLDWQSGVPHWDASLIRHLHDWEVDPFQTFLGFLYLQQVTRGQADQLCWSLA